MNTEELSLRDIQLSSLEILKEVDDICKKLKLDYFVMYGTLIGAARHSGFIPWDDDLDIMMPRADYDRLITYFNKEKQIGNIKLYNYDNCSDYPYMISRISDTRYKIIVDNEKEYGIGTFIDVYPLDGISNSYYYSLVKGRYYGWLSSLYFMSTRLHCPQTKSILKKGAFIVSKLIGKEKLKKMLINRKTANLNYVGCIQWMTNDYKRNIFHKSMLDGRINIKFEDMDVPAPVEYDQLLTYYYGDYMTLPATKERIPHHLYKAYRR